MKDYEEDDYLMLSGIQHFAFCRRQWALIHIEHQWQDNIHTVEGELMHEKAHDPYLREKRKDVIITRAMPISSKRLGISGECDIVEFHKADDGVQLHGHRGLYNIYPVEYKKGKPKDTNIDIMQLAAQVMCLEEMFFTTIVEGALFYGSIRKRDNIIITDEMRQQVIINLEEMHQLFDKQYTPNVKWSKKCSSCSLKDICLPELGKVVSVQSYMNKHLSEEEGIR